MARAPLPGLQLSLQFADPAHRALLPRHKVARWIRAGLELPATITVRIVDAEEGRTLNHAFVILDEAQNATPEQMKMFLTRIGFGTKAVVTGDLTQVDLPRGARSGLADASEILRDVKGIAVTQFGSADVVRHPLVAKIVDAYDGQRKRAASHA